MYNSQEHEGTMSDLFAFLTHTACTTNCTCPTAIYYCILAILPKQGNLVRCKRSATGCKICRTNIRVRLPLLATTKCRFTQSSMKKFAETSTHHCFTFPHSVGVRSRTARISKTAPLRYLGSSISVPAATQVL